MKNRVLSLDEVLALPEGARVWVEESPKSYLASRECVKHDSILECESGCYYDLTERNWYMFDGHIDVRVWSLPQPPTPDELAANPWPEARHD